MGRFFRPSFIIGGIILNKQLENLIKSLSASNLSESEEKELLISMKKYCERRIRELTLTPDKESYFIKVHNLFISDLHQYISSYMNTNNIDIPDVDLCMNSICFDKYTLNFIRKSRHQKLNNLQHILRSEVKDKYILEYIGINSNIRSLTKEEYVYFLNLRSTDADYPKRFIPNTLKTLDLFKS